MNRTSIRTACALAACVALGACPQNGGNSDDDGGPIDARIDSPSGPPPCIPPSPLCGTTCGNDQIDACFVQPMPGHCYYQPSQEGCDGTAGVPSCTSLGYYGGTATCPSCFTYDDSGCDACAPGNTACGTFPLLYPQHGIATSGGRVAIADEYEIAIFEGLTEVRRVSIPYVRAVAPVSGGWLVATDMEASLRRMDLDGNLGTAHEIDPSAEPQLTAGPGGRVLAHWHVPMDPPPVEWHVNFSIADSDGNTLVPPTDFGAITGGSRSAATTDGTSFFIASHGTLARIAPGGTFTLVSGFPISPNTTEDYVWATWGGSTGWYIAGATAQRFDATGALLGAPIPLTTSPSEVASLGDDLLVLRRGPRLTITRYDTSGTASAPVEIGAGGSASYLDLDWLGSELFVAWSRTGHLQAALAAPPAAPAPP